MKCAECGEARLLVADKEAKIGECLSCGSWTALQTIEKDEFLYFEFSFSSMVLHPPMKEGEKVKQRERGERS